MSRRVISGCLALAVLALVPGCSSDSTRNPVTPSPFGTANIADIATSAAAPDAAGVRMPGSAPSPNGGPRITVAGNETIINGGTLPVTITADAPFDEIYIFIGGRTLGLLGEFGGGIEGHYAIQLPAEQSSASVLLTFPQEIPLDQFDIQFAVSNEGHVGPYSALTTHVTRVGTGDVQVTLSWDADSDVDLHVVGPGGDEVFYGRRESPSGGELDLDSNAGCQLDGVRNENITWPTGRAPRGQYTVRVDYWDACGVNQTNFTVQVNNGGHVQVVRGSFTGSGDHGGPGSGRTVATFERQSGPTAIVSGMTAPMSTSHVLKQLVAPQVPRR